jgi:hypothetical protein
MAVSETLLVLPKVLTDVAVALLKLAAEDRTRQRLAELMGKVADCVTAIADSIEAGKLSTERCAELSAYVLHLHGLVAKETDENTADKLTFWLRHVEAVPGVARVEIGALVLSEVKPRWTKHGRFEQAEEVRKIAGMIRGVGNLINV